MRNPYRKIIFMQWVVIAVLVIGAAVGGYLMVHKLSDLQDDNTTLSGERDDLQNQLNQAQASATPSPTATPTPSPSPSPSPTATPAATRTPTPSPAKH